MQIRKLRGPQFIDPFWLNSKGRGKHPAIVADDGAIALDGMRLTFVREEDGLPPGTPVQVWIDFDFVCATQAEVEYTARQQELTAAALTLHAQLERAKRQLRWDEQARQDAIFNATLKLPVAWTLGIKDVLSGLSEQSDGSGRNRSTVQHILLKQDLQAGRIKRRAGDFLCSSNAGMNGKRWSSQVEEMSGRVTCKQCLALAQRWVTPPENNS